MHKFFTINSLQVLYDSLIHWLDVKWYWVAKTLVECSLVCLYEGVQYNCQQAKGSSDLLWKGTSPKLQAIQ